MAAIATFVFFDTETTGLIQGTDFPGITELAMLAVKRGHFCRSQVNDELNVDKFVMSFNPRKPISEEAEKLSGLTNELLETGAELNTEAFNAINSFINCLQKPVCLIAHNGFRFHYRVLKYYFQNMDRQFSSPGLMCADSLHAFFDLLDADALVASNESASVERSFEELQRPQFFAMNSPPANSYNLNKIYTRVVGDALETNRAENHSTMMLTIAQSRAELFCQWVDSNHCPFSQVPV